MDPFFDPSLTTAAHHHRQPAPFSHFGTHPHPGGTLQLHGVRVVAASRNHAEEDWERVVREEVEIGSGEEGEEATVIVRRRIVQKL